MSTDLAPSTPETQHRPAWAQREDEPPVAYSAFLYWLQQPLHLRERTSMADYARQLDYNDGGNSLRRYRRDYAWDERVGEWERHVLACYAAEARELRMAAARNHAALLDRASELVLTALNKVDAEKLTLAEAKNLLKLIGEQRALTLGTLDVPPAPAVPTLTVQTAMQQLGADGGAQQTEHVIEFKDPRPSGS